MFNRRPIWTVLAVIALVAMVFTLTPARAWASDFLGLFRVEKVQVITFDLSNAEESQNQLEANQDMLERIFQEDMQITEHEVQTEVGSTDEAAGIIGFTPRLPAEMANAELNIQPGMNAVFTINQPKLQELIDAMGIDLYLPEEVDGKVITLDMPDALTAQANCSEDPDQAVNCLSLIQLRSPVVNAPDELPVSQLGEAMFTLLGLSPEEARAMSQRIDWSTTLVIPMPSDGNVEVKDVNVDGVTGSLFVSPMENNFAMVWVKEGVLYGLIGPGSEAEAMSIAASMP